MASAPQFTDEEIASALRAVEADLGASVHSPSEIVDKVLPRECGLDTLSPGTVKKLSLDLDYVPFSYSARLSSFYRRAIVLAAAEDITVSAVAVGAVYFVLVSIAFFLLAACRKKHHHKHSGAVKTSEQVEREEKERGELESDADDDDDNQVAFSRRSRQKNVAAYGLTVLLALTSAAVMITSLVRISYLVDDYLTQSDETAEQLKKASSALKIVYEQAVNYATAFSALVAQGTLGCSLEGQSLVEIVVQEARLRVDSYFAALETVPLAGLDPLQLAAQAKVEETQVRTRNTQVGILLMGCAAILCVTLLAWQRFMPISSSPRKKTSYCAKRGNFITICAGAVGLLVASIALGFNSSFLFDAADGLCIDPDTQFIDQVLAADNGHSLARESLRYMTTCDESSLLADVLYQHECYSSFMAVHPFTQDEQLCLPDISSASLAKDISQAMLVTQALTPSIIWEFSCTNTNTLYAHYVYDGLCTTLAMWGSVAWISSLVFGVAIALLVLLAFDADWGHRHDCNEKKIPEEYGSGDTTVGSSMGFSCHPARNLDEEAPAPLM